MKPGTSGRLAKGGAWFDITLLGGLGLLSQQARFTQAFQTQLVTGTLWEIRTELEVRERPVLNHDTLHLLLTEDMQGLMNAIDGLHRLVHYTLPSYFH